MNVQVLAVFVLFVTAMIWEAGMLDLSVENVANVAVIRCSGRIVRSSAAYQLRNAVASELDSRAIVLDISGSEKWRRLGPASGSSALGAGPRNSIQAFSSFPPSSREARTPPFHL